MTDLLKTQAEWNQLFKVLGAEVQVFDYLEASWARAEKLRSGATIQQDQQPVYSSFDLAGQAVIGENTDIDGKLYVSFNIAPGLNTQIYKDSAKAAGDLVASGATASGVGTTLNEKNSSGFTGLIAALESALPGAFVADTDIVIDVTQDLKRLIEDAYDNVDDVAQDRSETASKDDLSAVAGRMETAFSQRLTRFNADVALDYIADFLGLTATDRRAGAGITYSYDTSSVAGQVLIRDRQGVMAELRQAMLDESNAGAQSVAQSTKSVGNLVANTTNVGKLFGEGTSALTAIGLILANNGITGRVDLRCTSDSPGITELTVENVYDDPLILAIEKQRQKTSTVGRNVARVRQQYQDGPAGVDFTAEYGPNAVDEPVESGDDGNMLSSTTLTGINVSDTNFGKVFGKMTRTKTTAIDGSDEFTFEIYADSARTNLRGTEIVSGIAGTVAISMALNGGATFNTTIHKANADTKLPNKNDEDADLEFDLQIPREGDRWSFTISVVAGSRFNKWSKKRYGLAFPESGAPTVAEGYAAFHPTLEA
jgi:hypothetical protein